MPEAEPVTAEQAEQVLAWRREALAEWDELMGETDTREEQEYAAV